MSSRASFCALFTFACVVGSTASACGGIDEPDLFSSGGGTTSPTDAGNVSKDSGSVTKDSGGGGRDSGGGGTDSGGGRLDSGGGLDPGIFCGNATVSTYCTGVMICCEANNELGSTTATFACENESACTGDSFGDLVIPCDDAFDCKGNICCGTFVSGSPSYYSSISCQSSCDGADARIFCDPANGNADCVNGGSCLTSGSLPGYHVCG